MPPRPHVLRVDPVMRCGPGIRYHVLGKKRPPTALPSMLETENIVLVDDPSAMEPIYRLRACRPRGRPAAEARSFLVAGPPPYCAQDPAWSELFGLQYLYIAFEWICDRLGEESRIIAAAIHRDEGVLHLHVLAVPIVDGRICWADLRVRFGEGVMGPTRYGRMQTKFYYEISRGFGLERGKVGSAAVHKRPDRKKGRALCELRRRQMHAIRQRLREAGESPGGIPELQDPEPWERVVMAQKAQPGDPERVAKWFRTVGLKVRPFEELCQTVELENIRPLPRAPQLMMLIRARVAARRRVLAQLKIAEEELEKFERIKTDDPVEGHNEVLLAEIGAWLQRVEAYREALQTGNYNAVETFTDDEPVPGFSTWATRELEEGLKAEDDAAERGYDLGGDADLDAEASDDPSSGKRQEQKPE